MSQQQIAIALLGYPPQLAGTARRALLRGETEPAGEVPGILEVTDAAAGGGHPGGAGGDPHPPRSGPIKGQRTIRKFLH